MAIQRKTSRLVQGSCSVCGKAIGGFSRLTAWKCPRCRKLFCRDCCPFGSTPKKLVCPECGTELQSVNRKKPLRVQIRWRPQQSSTKSSASPR